MLPSISCDWRETEGGIQCVRCQKFVRTQKRPHRRCPARILLTLTGRILIRLPPPGDNVATLAKYTGMASIVSAWSEIRGKPCKCPDRQAWLNDQWQRFVWRNFWEPVDQAAQ